MTREAMARFAPAVLLFIIGCTAIKVAIMDSGLRFSARRHLKNVREQMNWTDEPFNDDSGGHGTAVAGIIGSTNRDCPGLYPDAELYIEKVFTSRGQTETAWLMDAINHLIRLKVHVINLSQGGLDWLDQPFVDKINEAVANNIVVVAAVGNQGRWSGTVRNPADMLSVIGVGSHTKTGLRVASASSRGPTHDGHRIKPDLLAPGVHIRCLSHRNPDRCLKLTGTSFAAPYVTAAAALLLDAASHMNKTVNPAIVKQLLLESAVRI